MQPLTVTKYGFRIRTRNGAVVDNLSIFGRDEADARRKLRQMYNDCEILETHCQQASVGGRHAHLTCEDVMDIITAS